MVRAEVRAMRRATSASRRQDAGGSQQARKPLHCGQDSRLWAEAWASVLSPEVGITNDDARRRLTPTFRVLKLQAARDGSGTGASSACRRYSRIRHRGEHVT